MTHEKRGERTLRVHAAAVSMGAPARTLGSVRGVHCCRRVGRFAVAAVIAGAAVVAGVLPVSAQVLAPALSSVSVNGSALSLMFSDSLDEASLPPATSFAVTVSGASRDVIGVGIGGRAVTLTLADAAQAGEVVLVSYAVPSSNPVRGAGLVAVAAFADAAAVNGTAPRAPVLIGAVIDGHLARLTYDEYLLDLGTNSLASGFTVTVGGVDRSVLSATVTPSAGIDYVTYVNLVVDIAVQVGESVLVSYDPPASDPIQDVGGTPAVAYTDRSATNTTTQTKPGLLAAVIRGSAVTLTFSEALDTGSVPPAESFRFEVEGVERDVTDVTVGATEVSLTVAGEVQAGQRARISYADASSGPIRDLEHATPAAAFTNYTVINGTAARAPLLVTATVDASTVTLTYDEDLDTASTPPATSFEVTVSGTARPVQSAAVRGRTVVVVLVSPPVEPDQEVRVEYDAAASSPIRDIGGTPASAVTSKLVDRSAIRPVEPPVEPPVDPPVITTTGKTVFAYRENGTASLGTFRATDLENATVAWSVSGTDSDDFAISGTGVLSFANAPDFEKPADADRDNVYEVIVVAHDGQGHAGTLALTVTVTDVNEGPVVSGPQSVSFAENQATDRVLASYVAVDPEDPSGLTTRWSLSGSDAGDFTITDAGELSFRSVPDFERPADSNRDNVYSLSVRASDGRNYGYLAVTVTVEDFNEAPAIATTSRAAFTYRENGTAAIYTFRATDPERAAVSWSPGGPDGEHFAIHQGMLTFKRLQDFESPADADRDSVYEVTVVAADDQGLTDSVAVTVTVSDVNEGPEVSGPQSLSLAENQATDQVLAFYAASDPEDPSGLVTRWSLSGTDAGDFSVSETGELSFRKVPDYERPADSNKDNVYSLSVRASDGRNYGYLAVTVTVTDVNEAPEITTTAKTVFAYRENGTAAVFTFSAADPEQSAVAWSAGGADSGIFAVTRDSRGRGVLSFADPPNFEKPADAGRDNIYEVTVVATDDQGLTDTLTVTVTVTEVNEGPAVSGPQSLSFAENQATDQVLGTYDAVDPEDPFGLVTRWSLSGTDAGDFAVSDTGELTFRKVPDHERPADSNKDNVYSLSVRASDGRNYGYLAVTVTVDDVNEAPEITTTAKTAFAYRENGTAAVYTFSAGDPEKSAVAWSAGGADSGIFAVTPDSRGRGVLSFSVPPDFENLADADQDNVYEVTVVAADDQGLTDSVAVTVTVTEVNEGPAVSGPQSLSLAENQATDQVLAFYAASDPEDPSGPITRWSLSGTDAGDFAVSDTGELFFRKVPDHERPADSDKDNVYSLSVRASDGRNYGYLAVIVTVDDVNEAPEITTTARTVFAYRENSTAAVYTFSAADPEQSAVAWSAEGADSDDFAVTPDSRGRGVLAFANAPDFENPADADQDNVYEVTVVATDDQGLTDSVAVTVTVTEVNEGPEVSGPQSLSFAENQATDRVLAFYAASDPEDPSGPITRWSLSGTDAGDFAVSDTGELTFRKVPDHERPADSNKDNVYSLSIRASDGRNYGYLAVIVTVDDVNEAPEITTTAKTVFAYRENSTAAVYTFSAADPEQAAVAWSAEGADSGNFAVTPDSRGRGVLSFANAPDFENPADAGRDNVYEVTVVATDDQGLTDTLTVTVTVTEVNEGPEVSGPQSLSFAENQATDQVLAFYAASDPEDPSGPITRWSLSGTDAGDFAVSDTGELTFRKAPDYEKPADSNKDNVYSLSIRASDGRNYGYLAVTVTIENINEAPEITTTAKTVFAYRENSTAAVYTFSAADPEQAAVAWSAEGADSDNFAVTPDSRGRGVLSFANAPDFENPADADRDNVYEVTVVATDDQGLTDTLTVTVTVTEVNEGPEVSGPQSLSFAENQATDQVLAFYAASDPEDPSGPITRWSLSGTDAGDFAVSDTGELTFRKVPDHEKPADSNKDNVYSLSIRASDGRNYGYLAVTVTIENINEAPEITTTAKTVFAYRENSTAAVYTFSAADPEQAAVAWSAEGADSDNFAITPDSRGRGVLSFANAPDFESPADADRDNVYEVTVVATDDQGLTDTLTVTVTVTEVNEGPEVSGPQSLSFAENQATDQVLAFYAASDPEDPSGPITRWSLSGTDAGDFAVSDTGELTFRKAPDYERPADSNKDNVYSLSIRASDGRNYGYLAVTVTIENINEAPDISGSDSIAYQENGTNSLAVYKATDQEKGTISWNLSGADSGAFTISEAGVLAFNNPPDYEQPSDSDGNNVYEVTVEAADPGATTAFVEVTVTVTNQTD